MTLNSYDEVITSGIPWLPLKVEVPAYEMLKEAQNLLPRFVKHRDEDVVNGYGHRGWKSLCIHGISAEQTNHFTQYGYKSNDETPYVWTDIEKECPITIDFFKNVYPMEKYYRIRFMLLEAEGFITPHVDSDYHKLSPVNIALNHPEGCIFKMEKHGVVPMKPGVAMMLDVGNRHAYINKSKEDRIHIIVHGKPSQKFKELVVKSYASYGT